MINYTGLRNIDSYDENVNYIQRDQPKVKYQNRNENRLLNTPQYSSLLELDGLDDQEEEIKKVQVARSIGATQLTQHLATAPAAPTPIQSMHASSGGGVSESNANAARTAPTSSKTNTNDIRPCEPTAKRPKLQKKTEPSNTEPYKSTKRSI